MEKPAYYELIGSRHRAQREQWEEMKKFNPDKVCDVYPFSCEEAVNKAAYTTTASCKCIDKMKEAANALDEKRHIAEEKARFGALPRELVAEMTFDTFKANPDWRAHEAESALSAKEACMEYAASPTREPFLTLFGPVGSGKTHLALAIAQEVGMPVIWANSPGHAHSSPQHL